MACFIYTSLEFPLVPTCPLNIKTTVQRMLTVKHFTENVKKTSQKSTLRQMYNINVSRIYLLTGTCVMFTKVL